MTSKTLSEDSEQKTIDNEAKSFVKSLLRSIGMLVGIFVLSLFIDGWTEYNRQQNRAATLDLLEGMERLLQVVEDQTSPEAAARRESQLRGLLVQVDCNDRKALEEAFAAAGTTIEIVGENCAPSSGD